MKILKTGVLEVPKELVSGSFVRAYTYQQKNTEDIFSTVFKKGGKYYFPRNFSKLSSKLSTSLQLVDNTVTKEIPQRDSYINLLSHQKPIVESLFKFYEEDKNDVIIELGTGGGKTFMLAYIIPKLKQKTLVIVDQTLLVKQMFKELSENSDLEVSVLDHTMDLSADVVITTFQFLRQNDFDRVDKLSNEFGLVVVDEVHIAGAKSVTRTVQSINAKYRIGLSATPTRSDGLDEILDDLFEHRIVGVIEDTVDMEFILLENWSM